MIALIEVTSFVYNTSCVYLFASSINEFIFSISCCDFIMLSLLIVSSDACTLHGNIKKYIKEKIERRKKR